jgi:hypothetical protein
MYLYSWFGRIQLLDELDELLDESEVLLEELELELLDESEVLLEELELELLELESEPATFFFLPDLKSVSYQPPPFRRKPAAETFFTSEGFPHSGQSVSASSLTFCRVSNSCPQLSHRYS